MATLGRRRRPPGLLDGHNMILGHCGLVRYRVWSSGDALAGPGGPRRRLLDLRLTRSRGQRSGPSHPGSRFHYRIRSPGDPLHSAPPRDEVEFEVEQAATTASRGRERAT